MLSIFHHLSLDQQGSEEVGRDKGLTGCCLYSGKIISLQATYYHYQYLFFILLRFKLFHLSITAIERKVNLGEISIKISVVHSSVFKKT